MARAAVFGGLALAFSTVAIGQSLPSLSWTHPDGVYSLSFPSSWKVNTAGLAAGDVFGAEPVRQGARLRQCSASAKPLPTPPGCDQVCLNRSTSRFDFGGAKGVVRRDLNGVTIAEVTKIEDSIWARETVFITPGTMTATVHQLSCLAIMPVDDTDKAALNGVLASLKIGK